MHPSFNWQGITGDMKRRGMVSQPIEFNWLPTILGRIQCPQSRQTMMTYSNGQMETFSVLLALFAGNSSATGEFPSQSPVTRSFNIVSDLRLKKRLSKQSRRWWFEKPSRYFRNYDVTLMTEAEYVYGHSRFESSSLFHRITLKPYQIITNISLQIMCSCSTTFVSQILCWTICS